MVELDCNDLEGAEGNGGAELEQPRQAPPSPAKGRRGRKPSAPPSEGNGGASGAPSAEEAPSPRRQGGRPSELGEEPRACVVCQGLCFAKTCSKPCQAKYQLWKKSVDKSVSNDTFAPVGEKEKTAIAEKIDFIERSAKVMPIKTQSPKPVQIDFGWGF
jgi:hypothetical protein